MSKSKFEEDEVNGDDLLAACAEADGDVERFGFPFPPYPIQVDFMRGLYSTLQQRKHGIFESPTGTVNWRGTLDVRLATVAELRAKV